MAVLGLRFCARAFSSCGKRGPLFIAVRRPLTIAASLVVEHRLQTRRLSNRGSRAQLLRGMWDLPRPGLEPVSLALAGRFSTTAPPGKPSSWHFLIRLPVSCLLTLRSYLCSYLQNSLGYKERFPRAHVATWPLPQELRVTMLVTKDRWCALQGLRRVPRTEGWVQD